MVSETEKEEIRKQARKGQSVNQIKEELDIPKSTVYYHFRKEVGQKQKENRVQIPSDDEVIGELCGTFAGDGNFHRKKEGHYRIRIFLNLSDTYWEALADFLEERLQKRPNIYKHENKNLTTLDYSSKDLYLTFKENLEWGEDKTSTIRLNSDKNFSKEFLKGFLRGLIDTDGHKETKFRRYIYGTVSENLRDDFSRALTDLEIPHTNYREQAQQEDWKTMHKVRITGDSAAQFSKKIRPRHPKKKYQDC